jgi:lipopolysaccharide export system permease protein
MDDGILLDLNNGSIHEKFITSNEYRRTFFDNYKIAIPFNQLGYNENQNLVKQEREMDISLLNEKVKYFKSKTNEEKIKLKTNTALLDSLNLTLASFKSKQSTGILDKNKILNKINILNKKIKRNKRLIPIYDREKSKYKVETHKKFSVPFACIIFVLLGMPLGVLAKKSNMGISVAISLGIFIIYWGFLILGEDFADKNIIRPFIAMWAPNIFLGLLSYYLYGLVNKEKLTLRINLLKFLKK